MNYSYLPAQKLLDFFQSKLTGIRTGRINSTILDSLLVDAYGSKMHFNELATVTIPEATQLLITPFDKSVLNAMDKAIVDANIGFNPVNDGAGLRLIFPQLTEENKKQRIKDIAKFLEEVKISMRGNRQDILKKFKREKDDAQISEDELRRNETELQKEIDALTLELELMARAKEAELMKV